MPKSKAVKNSARNNQSMLLWLFAIGVYLFLYVPLLLVIVYSFNSSRLGVQWTGFTWHWYRLLFEDREMLRAAYHSLLIACSASAVSTVLGTLAGFALYRYRLRLLPALIIAPLAIPELLSGVSLLILFVMINLTLGLTSIILAHIAFCISFVAIVVRSRLTGMDKSLVEAARDLGATPRQSFFYITLPLIAPGIVAGALLSFTLSIDDFVITFFTAGVDASTLPLKIYTMIKIAVTPEVNAVSTLLVLLTLVLVFIAARLAPSILRSGD
jgi:spermidine/putrescine transport system permease protein